MCVVCVCARVKSSVGATGVYNQKTNESFEYIYMTIVRVANAFLIHIKYVIYE